MHEVIKKRNDTPLNNAGLITIEEKLLTILII